MNWKVEFYDNNVKKSIKEWPKKMQAKFIWVLDVIEKFGPADVGMPHVKAMGQGLFEIRIKANEGIGRAIFCTIKGKVVIILNGFIKKTQKTPAREIELARKRMEEVKKND